VKTKPTQHSVKELRSIGIQPDILLCRTDRYLSEETQGKDRAFLQCRGIAVITAKDVDCIYEVPLVFNREGLDERIRRPAQYLDALPAWKIGSTCVDQESRA
jgi:CTP synthase